MNQCPKLGSLEPKEEEEFTAVVIEKWNVIMGILKAIDIGDESDEADD